MNKLINQLDKNLKTAMLSGDKRLVSVIKGMKNALQYARVDSGPGTELTEQQTVSILQKESKKRADAKAIYVQAGDPERADNEAYEKEIIDSYLPELLSESEVAKLVKETIKQEGASEPKDMGKVISAVRQKSEGLAEGSLIARLVKEELGK